MKGFIITKGKYGATEQYAKWLGELLKLNVLEPETVSPRLLEKSEYLLIGSSIYIGKLRIKNWLRKRIKEIRHKKLFFFIVCGTPADEKEKLNEYIQNNIPKELIKNAEIFFLPGHLIYNKLSWVDKLLLKMGASFAKTKEEKKRMLTDYDHVHKENVEAIVHAVRKYAFPSVKV